MEYEFLSPEWIDAALAIRAEFADRTPPPEQPVRINLVVTDVPFEDEDGGRIRAFIDTEGGGVFPELGHLDDPELTLTVDYGTAKAILVSRDQNAASQAFLTGRLQVDGDITRLFFLQTFQPTQDDVSLAHEVATRLLAITR